MGSKYFEESERYFREYEVKNGLGREYVDQDRRTHGNPIRVNYEPDYSRHVRSGPNYYDFGVTGRKNRQSSVPPPIRRLHYNVGNHSQAPNTNVGSRYPPSSYPQSPYTGRYIPSSPVPIEKTTDSKQSYWPHTTSEFNPRLYYDRYEAERPSNKGPLLESTQAPFPTSTYPTTQTIYPTPSPTQHHLTPGFQPYTSRPGSPQQIVGVGDILNTDTGFTIQLDVKHFQAKDLKVTLVGNTLTVSGERIDEDPKTEQTLKRSFSRKYSIPTDILLDSIKAHLTDFGLLLIRGQRKNWRETEIPIEISEAHPKDVEPTNEPKPKESADQIPDLPPDNIEEPAAIVETMGQPKEHTLKPRPELAFVHIPHFQHQPYPDRHSSRKQSKDSVLKNTSATVTV